MKRVFALSLLALMLTPVTVMAEPCGWGKTTWGMSPLEVARSTGLSLVKTPEDKLRREGQHYSQKELLGHSFDVYFKFDKDEKLVSVFFYSRLTGSMGNIVAYLRLKDLLAEKYGHPALWQDSPERSVKQFKWVTICQVIDLSLIESKGSDSDTLSLSYRPNEAIRDDQF